MAKKKRPSNTRRKKGTRSTIRVTASENMKDMGKQLLGRPLTTQESKFLDELDDDETSVPKTTTKRTRMYVPQKEGSMFGFTSGATVSNRRDCSHYGHTLMYAKGAVELYGARGSQLDPREFDVIVDCGKTQSLTQHTVHGTGWLVEQMLPWAGSAEILQVEWPDYGRPKVDVKFWGKLWEKLEELRVRRKLDTIRVVFCCVGGHGRTGTGLASMMIADGMGVIAAINHVRAEHCNRAIEGKTQEEYLGLVGEYYGLKTATVDSFDTLTEAVNAGRLALDPSYASGDPTTATDAVKRPVDWMPEPGQPG